MQLDWRRLCVDLGLLHLSSFSIGAFNNRNTKLSYHKLAGWPALLTTSTFNRHGQHANSPGHNAYCYRFLRLQ